jgi:hypothetical protein
MINYGRKLGSDGNMEFNSIDAFDGWFELCTKMAPLNKFLNSKSLRLSVEHAGFELEEIKKLRDWFTDWRSSVVVV